MLHSFYAPRLRMRLMRNRNDRIVVISTRWLLRLMTKPIMVFENNLCGLEGLAECPEQKSR
jgi:hypothetical protein